MPEPVLIVGVTATRSGVSEAQLAALVRFLSADRVPPVAELHHGDCDGGDAQADEVARALSIRRVAHPPDNDKLRAHCKADVVLAPKPYKDRNKDIVEACGLLIAMPATFKEQQYGGTWSTVRHARRVKCPVLLILPDGTTHFEVHGRDHSKG